MIIENVALYVLLAQSSAVLFSAIGVVATILWNRILVRRRATLDMLLAEQTDSFLLEMRGQYLDAAAKKELASYAEPDKWSKPDMRFLVSILNRRELTAIGIRHGIIDEKLYESHWGDRYVRDWLECQEAVARRRIIWEDPTAFGEFETLAFKWRVPTNALNSIRLPRARAY